MIKYKSVFIDSESSLKSQWGMKKINGDNFARQITAALNEASMDGYELDQHIIIDSNQHTIMEGIILICKKNEKEKQTT